MESITLPALRPTVAVVESLVAMLSRRAIERARLGAAEWNGSEGDYLGRGYRDTWDEYTKTGTYDGTVKTLLSITIGNRVRTDTAGVSHPIEHFADIESPDLASCTIRFSDWTAGVIELVVDFNPWGCSVKLDLGWRFEGSIKEVTIEEVEGVLTASARPWEIAPPQRTVDQPFRVFIGHGNDYQWRVLKDALRDHHGFEVEAFEGMPRTGEVIRDVLDGMVRSCTAGVLVLTKADEQKDGTWRGRQNVIHEIGYVQAVLGWARAIIVVEEGVVLPTNLDGTQQIRYDGRIEQAEGQVAAALNLLKSRPQGICP